MQYQRDDIFYKMLFFVYAKVLFAYQFYFAYIFSQESKYYTYAFIIFFIIERCISIILIHSVLDLKNIDKLMIVILGVFCCDEFYLFYRSDVYPEYLVSGIVGQSLLVLIASIPNQVIFTYYSYQYPADAFAIYAILYLIFLMSFLALLFQNSFLDFQNKLNNHQVMLRTIKEVFITSFKVLTNVSLFILNMRSNQFLGLFIFFIFILAIINAYSINKRVKFISSQRQIQIQFIYLKYIAYFLDLIVDLRQLQSLYTQRQIDVYGNSFFNKANLSSLFMKIFLFSYYLNNRVIDLKLYYTECIVVIVAIIIISIQLIRLINYIILIDLLEPIVLEIDSIEDLKYYKNKSILYASIYKKVQQVMLFHNEDKQQQQLYIQFIFSKFEQSEVKFQSIQREYIMNQQNKHSFSVNVAETIDLSMLFESLKHLIILPQIKEIQINSLNQNDQYRALTLMIENNVFIYLYIYSTILNKEIVDEINKIKIQISAFNNLIYHQMTCNPNEILYDLYC